MAVGKTSASFIYALYNLSKENDANKRKSLLSAGLVEMIKWFSLAPGKIIEGKMKLPKQTKKIMDRHKDGSKISVPRSIKKFNTASF